MQNQDNNQPVSGSQRVQEHRERVAFQGLKRVEVKVSKTDEWFIRSIAKVLCDNEEQASLIRNELSHLLPPRKEQSIVDFFRSSPLANEAENLDFERSKDTGTPLSF